MPDIPFTQYLRPDGRKVPVFIDRPENISSKAAAIIDAGNRFECEQLMTGQISLTVVGERDGEEQDLDIEVVANNEAVPAAIDRMVERFVFGSGLATA